MKSNQDKTDNSYKLFNKNEFLKYIDTPAIDYFLGQYTPPSPYPWTNEDMDESMQNNIFDSVLEAQLLHFINSCNSLSAKYAIPCAGPAEVKSDYAKSTEYSREKLFNKEGLLKKLSANLKEVDILDV